MRTRGDNGFLACYGSSGGESHALDELFSDIQFGGIGPETGEFGIDEFLAKQLAFGQSGQDLEFRRREFQSDQYQVRPLWLCITLFPGRIAVGTSMDL